jgi:hypothetical protein
MHRVATDSGREWLKLSEYAAGLGQEDWQEVIWPSDGTMKFFKCKVSRICEIGVISRKLIFQI